MRYPDWSCTLLALSFLGTKSTDVCHLIRTSIFEWVLLSFSDPVPTYLILTKVLSLRYPKGILGYIFLSSYCPRITEFTEIVKWDLGGNRSEGQRFHNRNKTI